MRYDNSHYVRVEPESTHKSLLTDHYELCCISSTTSNVKSPTPDAVLVIGRGDQSAVNYILSWRSARHGPSGRRSVGAIEAEVDVLGC